MKRSKKLFRLLLKSPTGTVGVVIVCLVLICAVFAGQIATQEPGAMDLINRTKPPFWMEGGSIAHLLGTDNLGRDIFSRILYGTRVSLVVGILATMASGILGLILGIVSGYYGGWVDHVIMRIADAFFAIPGLLLALVALMVFKKSGILTLVLVIAAISWVPYARLIRADVLRLKEKEFIKAALTEGASSLFIILHHILPNVWASFIVISTSSVAGSIITEASLSFLGVGIQEPLISWGGMLASGRTLLATHWWVATFPGIMITVTILGIIFLGNWLRDVLDPRNKGL